MDDEEIDEDEIDYDAADEEWPPTKAVLIELANKAPPKIKDALLVLIGEIKDDDQGVDDRNDINWTVFPDEESCSAICLMYVRW